MPRVIVSKAINRRKKGPARENRPNRSVSVLSNEEAQALIAEQLAKVVQQEVITQEASVASQESIVDSLREDNFSSNEDAEKDQEMAIVKHLLAEESSSTSPSVGGSTQEDKALRGPKVVPVRFSSHEPSPYVVAMRGIASKVEDTAREPIMSTLEDWVAPAEDPIALDRLAAETHDLYVDKVNPWMYLGQFTPGDYHEAYREQYGTWSRVRAPFIRWEVGTISFKVQGRRSVSVTRAVAVPKPSTPGFFARLFKRFKKIENEVAEEVVQDVERVEESANETWTVPVLIPRLYPSRVIVGFMGLLFAVSLPAGAVSLSRSLGNSVGEIKTTSYAALDGIKEAVHSSGSDRAHSFHAASAQFREAEETLSRVNASTLAIAQALPQTRDLYQSSRALLTAGQKASEAAGLLSQGLDRAMELNGGAPDERLIVFATYADRAAPLLEEAIASFQEVKAEALPKDVREKVSVLQGALVSGQESVRDLRAVVHFLIKAVGHESSRRYLLVFQNHTELRPTGGFMGSVAEITLDRGRIKQVYFPGGGPYDMRSQLIARVLPPEPLRLLASRWEFQDANWFPDFPTAAEKIRWFWSKSGQSSVDGVIAVNATMLEKVLAITGPIEMAEYGKTVTAENVLFETQKAVELEYDREENKPKKFVGDLMQKVIERLKDASAEDQLKYIALLNDAFETKEVQASFFHPEEEALATRLGWSGRLKPTIGDSLSIIGANIGGQKTDGVIQEDVKHEAAIQLDGSIINTVQITRRHDGQRGELFRGANNVQYLRVYVPEGSQLLEASGFQPPDQALFKQVLAEDSADPDVERLTKNTREGVGGVDVTDEFGRTSFGGWVQLKPGATSVTVFRYRLPFTINDLARAMAIDQPSSEAATAAYLLLLSSQSGKLNRTIDSRVSLPAGWGVGWRASASQSSDSSPLGFKGTWDRDHVVAGLINRP